MKLGVSIWPFVVIATLFVVGCEEQPGVMILQGNTINSTITGSNDGTGGWNNKTTETNTTLNVTIYGTQVKLSTDNSFFSVDDGNNARVGLMKKTGALPKIVHGSASSLTIARSSTTSILPSSTYTDEVTIDTTGKLGIGTTTPQAALEVNVGNVAGILVNSSNSGFLCVIGNAAGKTGLCLRNSYSSNQMLEFQTGVNPAAITTTQMAINATSGFIGMGTTTPKQKLDVVGSANVSSTLYTPQVKFVSTSSVACNSGNEGTTGYNYTSHKLMYCNSTSWVIV